MWYLLMSLPLMTGSRPSAGASCSNAALFPVTMPKANILLFSLKKLISSFVSKGDITKYIENANEAFGGLQTYGKMRLLF